MNCSIYLGIIGLFFIAKNGNTQNCKLNLKTDFGISSPVFIQKNEYLNPDSTGKIEIPQNGSSNYVTVICPGKDRHLVLDNVSRAYNETRAYCVANQIFRTDVDSWQGHFKEIQCKPSPYFSVEDTAQSCAGRHTLYRVGYRSKKKFYTLYHVCFDKDLLTTLYVKHKLTPGNYYLQSGGSRPNFVAGDNFGKVHMSELYKMANQKKIFENLLGNEMGDKYITIKQYLNRGHLAPRADFSLRAPQHASFHYINAVPQWRQFNAGDWAALEEAIRRRSFDTNVTLTIYTGTHRVLTLANSEGDNKEVFLTTDENNNNVVPVPLYFYKVVHDPRTKRATAFVSINSSFYNQSMVEKLTFCEDICSENTDFKWLRWRNDGTHSFCCEYEDFLNEIKHLPEIDVDDVFT